MLKGDGRGNLYARAGSKDLLNEVVNQHLIAGRCFIGIGSVTLPSDKPETTYQVSELCFCKRYLL